MNEESALISSRKEIICACCDRNANAPISNSAINCDKPGLSVFFTILCIVDLFGVFPVIALPKSAIACGLYAVPIILFVFTLQIYTAILLGRCWSMAKKIDPTIIHKNRYPYAAIAELTYGPIMSNCVTVLLDATIFGGGIPNLLVASQNLQLFGLKMTDYKLNFSFCWWLIIIGILLCPIMWLGSPKDMKVLAIVSVLVVGSVAIITWLCILEEPENSPPYKSPIDITPSLDDILTAYGIIAFQFDIHPMLLTIQVDMKHSSKINFAVIGGFLVSGLLFTTTAILSAYQYGNNIRSNILQGLPPSLSLYCVVFLVTLQLCLSSAVGSSALFQHIEDKLGIPREFSGRRCITRATVVALAVFIGEAVPRFDLVMGLIGSTLTGPLMFILPPLLYLKLLHLLGNSSKFDTNTLSNCTKIENDDLNLLDNNYTPLKKRNQYDTYTTVSVVNQNVGGLSIVKSKSITCREFNSCTTLGTLQTIANDEKIPKAYRNVHMTSVFLIFCFGIIATIISIYYSWSNAISFTKFTPPCLINITAASFHLNS